MQFNTVEFFLFLPAVLALYYCLGRRAQNGMLVVASYVFYGWWDWRFLGLLLISTTVDFLVAQRLPRAHGRGKRLLLLLSLVTNLGILGLFKYFNFFTESFAGLLQAAGLEAHAPTLKVILPVGISFYTFQTLAYTIDVYRGRIAPTGDPVLFALYVSFFPQLVAGPIERAQNLLPQFARRRTVTGNDLAQGAFLILIGLVRKVAIADVVAGQVSRTFYQPGSQDSATLLLGVLLFALQIYGDFAGYSDIARGSARLMGIELMINFQHPYFATNITEFWRRWHISLSSWLRDYLYIPLGGNRRSGRRTYINLMTTMLLGGLWHGAQWTFVVWGFLHGMALVVHRLLRRGAKPAPQEGLPAGLSGWVRALAGWSSTMALVGLAWIFFRAPDFSTAFAYLGGIVNWRGGVELQALLLPAAAVIAMLLLDLPQARSKNHTAALGWPAGWRAALYAGCLVLLLATKDMGNETFIYFQF